MAQLMHQRKGHVLRPHGQGQGDPRAEHPRQARPGQGIHLIHRQGLHSQPGADLQIGRPLGFRQLPNPGALQIAQEGRIPPEHPPAHACRSRQVHQQEPLARPPIGGVQADVLHHPPRRDHRAALLRTVRRGLLHHSPAQGHGRVLEPHTDLIRHGPGFSVLGVGRAQFVHGGVGQRNGQKQPHRHQQPRRVDHPAAQLSPQQPPHQQHQQDHQPAEQRRLQQVVEYRHCPDGKVPVAG